MLPAVDPSSTEYQSDLAAALCDEASPFHAGFASAFQGIITSLKLGIMSLLTFLQTDLPDSSKRAQTLDAK